MDGAMELLRTPAGLGAAGGVVVVLLALLVWQRSRGARPKKTGAAEDHPEIARLVGRGEFGAAGQVAARLGKLEAALDYYLRAQQPGNAAAIAARMNNLSQAAELYERAKAWEQAAVFYDKCGQADKAAELRRLHLPPLPSAPPVGAALAARAGAGPAGVARPSSGSGVSSRGRELEGEYRRSTALVDDSPAARAELSAAARAAAEALLAEGEIRRAADVYRDAGFDDEAIHLYVNVLGDPGAAAPILAARGNHTRAAELFELAGDAQRAASTWVEVARAAPRPDAYLDRIEHLSRDTAVRFLEGEAARRPADAGSAEIHYRLGGLYAKRGDSDRALGVLKTLRSAVGGYRDVDAMIRDLAAGKDLSEADRAELAAAPATDVDPAAAARAKAGGGAAAGIDDAQVRQLAEQVARVAGEQLRRSVQIELGAATQITLSGPTIIAVAGLEGSGAPMKIELLGDGAVRAARGGPSIETLQAYLGGRPCDLQNIEVYYRLGLAHLARGDWEHALADFDAVEEASPGYRDAWKRADEIRDWQKALGARRTKLGAAPDGGSRYQLRGELGRGGMAVVYRAFDSLLGREVALKFLSESLSGQPEMKELFEREARAVAALNHPNIVTIHDVGVLEGRAFLCMEFVEGKSVETLMTEAPGLTIVESLRIVKQVLDALAYAHGRKIIHRDIKPANMMRTPAGLVKLMDFGLAKSIEKGTQQSVIAGTPEYMPPEQLRGDKVDARADLFAIAVSLYQMISGELPFAGMERNGPPVKLSSLVPAIPPVLDDVVMRGLALDPQRRVATAAELAAPLQQVIDAVAHVAAGQGRPQESVGTAPTMISKSQKTTILPGG